MTTKSRTRNKTLIRKGIYSIDEVLSKTVPVKTKKKDCKVNFDGDLIKMNSQRYELFKNKGVKCVDCGIEGKYFVKEKHPSSNSYHFNLYAINKRGKEVLMTKDHIIRKRDGGADSLENYQTMCTKCNQKKG